MTRTRNVSNGKLLAGAKPDDDSEQKELPNFSLNDLSTSRDLANVVEFMRRMGVSELRLGKFGLALAPDWAPRAAPLDELQIEATQSADTDTDPYSDPDLYPDGQVPSFDEDED